MHAEKGYLNMCSSGPELLSKYRSALLNGIRFMLGSVIESCVRLLSKHFDSIRAGSEIQETKNEELASFTFCHLYLL